MIIDDSSATASDASGAAPATGSATTGSAADLLGAAAGGSNTDAGGGGAVPDGDAVDVGSSAADPDFYQHLSAQAGENNEPSLRDWAKAANVTSIDGLAKLARDNMRALRDAGRVKVPGEGAKPEEIKAFHQAIGVPDDAKGYAITAPKDANGEPIPLDTQTLGVLADSALAHGVPKSAFEGLVADFISLQLDQVATQDREQLAAAEKIVKSWGNDAPANQQAITLAAEAFGLSSADLVQLRNALGAEKAIDMLVKIGSGMSEDTMISGGRQRFGMSGQQAEAELATLMKDTVWVGKAMKPGTPENAHYRRLNDAIGDMVDRKARAA